MTLVGSFTRFYELSNTFSLFLRFIESYFAAKSRADLQTILLGLFNRFQAF